jgi:MFS family permease
MIVTPRSTRNVSSRPGRSQARFAFSILFAVDVLNYVDRYILAAILPKVQHDLGLTTIEEGLLGSSFLLVYGLTTLPLGVWADRGVRKNIISLCVCVWSVATTLGGLSRHFWHLISARTVLGIGGAGYGPASLSLLGDFFPRAQRGRVLSYWSVGNLVGAAIGFTLGG